VYFPGSREVLTKCTYSVNTVLVFLKASTAFSWCFLACLEDGSGPGRRGRAPLSSAAYLTDRGGLQGEPPRAADLTTSVFRPEACRPVCFCPTDKSKASASFAGLPLRGA